MPPTDHLEEARQSVINVIVALRRRKTASALELAQRTEDALNAIPEKAALYAHEHADGKPMLIFSRMMNWTPGVARYLFEFSATMELKVQLASSLKHDLELANLTSILYRTPSSTTSQPTPQIPN